jgi:Zn-dependent protease with chaperone function
MRLDTANRSFATLLGASLLAGMFVFCGAVGCVLVILVASEVGEEGWRAFTSGGESLWPAILFIAIVGAGVAAAIWSLGKQIRASKRLARRVEQGVLTVPDELAEAAGRARLGGRVRLVASEEPFSFAYGALSPRVAISRGLLEAASEAELGAVLVHERYHVHNLDPLKVLLARALPAAFFYAPVFRSLHERYVAGRELAADRRAVESCGSKPLAGALFKVVSGPAWPELRMAAAIGGPDLLDARVAQLETGTEPRIATPSRRALVASALGPGILAALFVASVISFGGPSAVSRTTGADLGPLDIASVVLCAAPWAAGLWLGYRWLARRTARGT